MHTSADAATQQRAWGIPGPAIRGIRSSVLHAMQSPRLERELEERLRCRSYAMPLYSPYHRISVKMISRSGLSYKSPPAALISWHPITLPVKHPYYLFSLLRSSSSSSFLSWATKFSGSSSVVLQQLGGQNTSRGVLTATAKAPLKIT